MLYDEYERLLDSRFLKKEVINAGETLTFDSYLVEIGDKCGDNAHESVLNYQGKDKKVSGVSGMFNQESHNNTNSFGNGTLSIWGFLPYLLKS